jgi:hypothetical protein
MNQKSVSGTDLEVGDRVRLILQSLAWKAETTLQGQIGEVIERRDDGRVTIRFANDRLLMGRDVESFERVLDQGLEAKKRKFHGLTLTTPRRRGGFRFWVAL